MTGVIASPRLQLPRRSRTLAAILAAVLVTGCGTGAASSDPPADETVLAISTPLDGSTTLLRRLDARTLAPRPGGFDLGEYHDAWAFSPDRRTLAVGTFARTGLRLIDPVTLRLQRDVPMPIAAIGVGWIDPARVAVLLQRGGVVLVDAQKGRIQRRWPLEYGWACQGRYQAVTPHGVVFLVASRGGGRLRLLRIDPSGELDVVALARIRSPSSRRACSGSALAVDPTGGRAFVAGSAGPAAIVDLRSLRVTYRPERRLDGPCRRTVRLCAARRSAVWAAPGTLAVAGIEYVVRRGARPRERTLGLTLIDTTTWSSRVVDRSAAQVAAMRDGSWLAISGRRPGIRAVTPSGDTRWTALRGTQIRTAQATSRHVYALDDAGKTTYVLDAASGRTLATSAGRGRLEVLSGRDDAGDP